MQSPAEMNQTQSSFWSTSALMGLSLPSVLTFSAVDYRQFHKIAEDSLLFLILECGKVHSSSFLP